MNKNAQQYVQGFEDRCKQANVNIDELIKWAQGARLGSGGINKSMGGAGFIQPSSEYIQKAGPMAGGPGWPPKQPIQQVQPKQTAQPPQPKQTGKIITPTPNISPKPAPQPAAPPPSQPAGIDQQPVQAPAQTPAQTPTRQVLLQDYEQNKRMGIDPFTQWAL